MKSRVYLDPMSPDGTPGEVRELQVNDGAPQFLAPVSYAENDDLGKLRHNVHTAAAALRHAKARGTGVAQAQKAHEDAKTAAGKAHYEQQKARTQQKTGIDFGAPSPFSRDTRQFAEVVDYSVDNVDEGDYADDLSDDELEAAIKKAVDDLEQAQSNGATPTEMEKLSEALRVLRAQLPNPSAPVFPAAPRKSQIGPDSPGSKPASQEAAPAVKKKKPTKAETKAGWDSHLAELDRRLAKRALASVYPTAKPATSPATHARNASVCCEGQYKCSRCKAKAAAA
jgi:hypothetical protein